MSGLEDSSENDWAKTVGGGKYVPNSRLIESLRLSRSGFCE